MCAAAVAAPRSVSLTVVGAMPPPDPRWEAVEEAVGYWNDQLAAIGAGIRVGPVQRLIQPVPDNDLLAMSYSEVSRSSYTGYVPQFPVELASLPGDIIIALSTLDFVSFGHPLNSASKGLVAISRADLPPRSLPNVLRNLVAHEMGHALGLRHNADPAMLMCGRPAPCRPGAFASPVKRWFPLTEADKANLVARWPPR